MRHRKFKSRALRKYQPAGYRFSTANYDLFQVIYVCTGELVFKSDMIEKTLSQGEAAILRKSSDFELSCLNRSYTGVAYHALGDLPAEFIGPAEIIFAPPEIRSIAQLMQCHFTSPVRESGEVLDCLATCLAWESIRACRENPHEGESGSRFWAAMAKNALDGAVFTPLTTRRILASIPMSYRHLSRHFMHAYGVSPKTYQLTAKIDRAKNLLRETKMSITQIAMELGFSSSQHFATQFRNITGTTAGEYR